MSPTTRSILYFIKRTAIFAITIITPFIVWYICTDPFKILYPYDEYYENPETHNTRIGLNKGVVSVNTYLNNFRDIPYNAFIFGSSISCYYSAAEWKDLIQQDSTKVKIYPFHFDSSSETPMSMARKVKYLADIGAPIDHALIILDPIILETAELESPFAIDPVEIHPGIKHFIKFHYTFFRASTNADFIKNIIAAKIAGEAVNIGHSPIFERQPIIHDKLTNEESLPSWDSLIAANPTEFYSENPLVPASQNVTQNKPVINDEKRIAFQTIADIFKRKQTDYQIIISPNRRGVALSTIDLQLLKNIFSPSRIHDFSSIYASDLQTDSLLYDNTHYRPQFASKMMRAVYTDE